MATRYPRMSLKMQTRLSLPESRKISSLVRLWILRMLVPLSGHREFIMNGCFSDDALAETIGLGKWVGDEIDDFPQKSIGMELLKLHRVAESKLCATRVPTILKDNVEHLAKLVGLSDTDCRILEFTVLLHTEKTLDRAADSLGQLSSVNVCNVLATLLSLSRSKVKKALEPNGILRRSGLVCMDRSEDRQLKNKLDLLSDHFADHIVSTKKDLIKLLSDVVSLSAQPDLFLDDYSHIADDLTLLLPYLKESIATRRKGVNIFLYGPPGTGKTQFVKVLAKETNCNLFDVTSEDEAGEMLGGEQRLRAFSAAQTFFGKQNTMILFDEIEDAFDVSESIFQGRSTAQAHKAWVNRALEENPVPAFWVSNSVQCMDPAFLRRFDMVIELPIPPKSQRAKIIQAAGEGLLDAQTVARLAESERLSPANVTRAVSIVRSITNSLPGTAPSSAIERLIGNKLRAHGQKTIQENSPDRLPETYNPAFIHADTNLTEVAAGLAAVKSGRLCLYGPPGTGKTAYGRWLAGQLELPLIEKRASDLMSEWVGKSEKNIAAAFAQAKQEDAMLMIDEVDSFLQDRRGAQRSWEVSMVNEMLTQMESFSGVFIASTNLMSGLDQAALRRFDLKVKFDFIKPEHAWELFCRHCTQMKLPAPRPELKASLARLIRLTPGDYAAVSRQQRFRPLESPEAVIAALQAECALKEGPKGLIGFL